MHEKDVFVQGRLVLVALVMNATKKEKEREGGCGNGRNWGGALWGNGTSFLAGKISVNAKRQATRGKGSPFPHLCP